MYRFPIGIFDLLNAFISVDTVGIDFENLLLCGGWETILKMYFCSVVWK
jgi:hypothetical protein